MSHRIYGLVAVLAILPLSSIAARADEELAPDVRILAGNLTMIDNVPFASFSCEVRNPGQAPLMFVGYRPDSFDPVLADGQVAPIYSIEVERGGAWETYPTGWCGTGMDGIELAAGGSGAFGFAVPVELPWEAVRVGVRWSQPLDYETAEAGAFQTAWSEPFKRTDIAEAAAKHHHGFERLVSSRVMNSTSAGRPHGAPSRSGALTTSIACLSADLISDGCVTLRTKSPRPSATFK